MDFLIHRSSRAFWLASLLLANLSLGISFASTSSVSINGSTADYGLRQNAQVDTGATTVRVGASNVGNTNTHGRIGVLIFALPTIGPGNRISSATLAFAYSSKTGSPTFNADLWGIGFYTTTAAITNCYLAADTDPNATSTKLQDNVLVSSSTTGTITSTDFAAYIQGFYTANPNYTGGSYVFLRINPDADPGSSSVGYNLNTAENSSGKPVLNLVVADNILDTVQFGGTTGAAASETAHGLSVLPTSAASDTVTGGLGQPARRCLPLSTVDIYGGALNFTMAVDPVRRNYFTIRLWGSDDTDETMGRFLLYMTVNGVDYQVGYRHEGDYGPLSVTASKPPLPGRFFYSTTLLPLSMTQGKTSVTLKIVSTGELYGLGAGGPPSGTYQLNMTVPSRGIYAAYTHVDPFFTPPASETQGTMPTGTIQPAVTESSVLGATGTYTNGLNTYVSGRLGAVGTAFTTTDVSYLARAYSVPLVTNAYQKQSVIDKVVALLDEFCTHYYEQPLDSVSNGQYTTSGGYSESYSVSGGNEVWGGRFGPLGWAIDLLINVPSFQSSLDVTVTYGSTGVTKTRRQAWGDMLVASRDYGRFNRRGITNQTMAGDSNVYLANRALLDLGNVNAFAENDAQRYLREACGLSPWLGSDLPGGGSSYTYGSTYYMVTTKGQTREWGAVGIYGEMWDRVSMFYKWTGNQAFLNQAVKIEKNRAALRRPSLIVSGSNYYQTMEREGIIAWRGVREADGYFANDLSYGETATFSGGMLTAGLSLDPTLIGYAKQMLADNQYFNNLVADARYYKTAMSFIAFEVYDTYAAVKAAADSGIRLPMTDGQPDFVWTDEESGVLAIKHGTDRLWIAPYWQAKAGTGINGIARFHYSTPTYDQYGILETVPQFTSQGIFTTRSATMIDSPGSTQYSPANPPVNAYGGEILPLGVLPSDAQANDPFRGKVDFYSFRFGRYLVGMNRTSDRSFVLKTPSGFTSDPDLVSGATISGSPTVAANSTMILYLDDVVDTAPVPTAPLALEASGSTTQNTLNWSASSGAATYTLRRASNASGPFVAIATNLTTTTYTDSGLSGSTPYYYQVSAVNPTGESYPSMTELGLTGGLPSPWTNTDVGSVGTPGSTTYLNGAFTVNGEGTNVGSTADSCQYACQTLTGDGVIVGRLAFRSLAGTGDKVGLMVRSGSANSAGAINFSVMGVATGTTQTSSRGTAGGATTTLVGSPSFIVPAWFKIQRKGNVFTGYISNDGATWALINSATITMASTVNVGMFVCSRVSGAVDTSIFDNVAVATTPPALAAAPTATGGNEQVALSWSAVNGATGYRVKRGTASGIYSTTFDVTGTTCVDTGLSDGTTYYYVVSALNGPAESDNSSAASATTYTAIQNWRLLNFGSIDNSGNAADSADPDGDGWTNFQEFNAGTDPNDRSSALKIGSLARNGNDVVISFPTVSGKTYRVDCSTTLQAGSWTTVQDNLVGTGGVMQVTDTGGATQMQRFYRITVQ
ncbi:MAG: hypothetical protein QM796_14540 [Chthoniobacteraceae bacterium]